MEEHWLDAFILTAVTVFNAVMAFAEWQGEAAEVRRRQVKLNELELETVRALYELEQATGGLT